MDFAKSAFATKNQGCIKAQTWVPTNIRMSTESSLLFNLARLLADEKSASRPPSSLKRFNITILHIENKNIHVLRMSSARDIAWGTGGQVCIGGSDLREYLRGRNCDCYI